VGTFEAQKQTKEISIGKVTVIIKSVGVPARYSLVRKDRRAV